MMHHNDPAAPPPTRPLFHTQMRCFFVDSFAHYYIALHYAFTFIWFRRFFYLNLYKMCTWIIFSLLICCLHWTVECWYAMMCVCMCYVRLLVDDNFFSVWFGDCTSTSSNSSCSVASNFIYMYILLKPFTRFGLVHIRFSLTQRRTGVQNSMHCICHHMLF